MWERDWHLRNMQKLKSSGPRRARVRVRGHGACRRPPTRRRCRRHHCGSGASTTGAGVASTRGACSGGAGRDGKAAGCPPRGYERKGRRGVSAREASACGKSVLCLRKKRSARKDRKRVAGAAVACFTLRGRAKSKEQRNRKRAWRPQPATGKCTHAPLPRRRTKRNERSSGLKMSRYPPLLLRIEEAGRGATHKIQKNKEPQDPRPKIQEA